ncbi:MAG: hypothetical protein ACP5OA_04545 [Candidatus Woesearchaeota archaeon]
MAVDVLTVVLTAICTGIGVSIGTALYEIYLKDPIKRLKKENARLKKLHFLRMKKARDTLITYKRPWLAALLNIFIWGLGYLYVGRRKTLGTILFLTQLFIFVGRLVTPGNFTTTFEGASYGVMIVIISATLGVDAYSQARKVDKGED